MPGLSNTIPEVMRYHNPPGWPVPSRRWVLEHQGAAPAPGWVPPVLGRPQPAPTGWRFWTFDGPEADRYGGAVLRKLRGRMRIDFVVALIGLLLTAVTAATAASSGGGLVVFGGAILFGTIGGFRNMAARDRAESVMFAAFAETVAQAREEILRLEYEADQVE